MEPGCESRFATKTSDGAKQLNENILSEVFSLWNIFGHAKTNRKDAAMMFLVELVENFSVTFG
jgi:hypothetical protein